MGLVIAGARLGRGTQRQPAGLRRSMLWMCAVEGRMRRAEVALAGRPDGERRRAQEERTRWCHFSRSRRVPSRSVPFPASPVIFVFPARSTVFAIL